MAKRQAQKSPARTVQQKMAALNERIERLKIQAQIQELKAKIKKK